MILEFVEELRLSLETTGSAFAPVESKPFRSSRASELGSTFSKSSVASCYDSDNSFGIIRQYTHCPRPIFGALYHASERNEAETLL